MSKVYENKGALRLKDRIRLNFIKRPFHDQVGDKHWANLFSYARKLRTTYYRVAIPNWPQGIELRVVFLSDLHVGSHTHDILRLRNIIQKINTYDPDFILLGGDYVNMMPFFGGRIPPAAIARELAALKSRLGVYAVMGNHDAEYGLDEIRSIFSCEGIQFLENTARNICINGENIFIAGVDDEQTGNPNLDHALSCISKNIAGIVIAHNPNSFHLVNRNNILMLCGHTHGGQLILPGFGAVYNSSKAPMRWTYGHIREEQKQMIVSSGIGTSGLPFRLGTWPEICIITCQGEG